MILKIYLLDTSAVLQLCSEVKKSALIKVCISCQSDLHNFLLRKAQINSQVLHNLVELFLATDPLELASFELNQNKLGKCDSLVSFGTKNLGPVESPPLGFSSVTVW